MNENCQIVLQEDGLYITVLPACGVSLAEMGALLRERGVLEYDGNLVKQALADKLGVPVRVGGPQEEIKREAEIKVRPAEDMLSCELWFVPPVGLPMPSPDKLRGVLQEKGIVYGIQDDILMKIVDEGLAKQWIVVAWGNAPVNGKDAQIIYKVDLEGLRPKHQGRDSVNMKELGTVVNVLKGQEIAEKIPVQTGQEGMSVAGKKIPAYVGKDKNLPMGKGTAVTEDKIHLISKIDGHLRIKDGKFTVDPHFEVNGDVDYSVGNIDFVGPVTIKGSIREGFEVVSGGTLTVEGVVEGATLISHKDIVISVGIRGMSKAKIEAAGDVRCGYIDQATVRSNGSIYVTDAILHSDVSAREEINLQGDKKGQIVGGRIQASLGISCDILGGEMETKTDVSVGVFPEVAEERKRLILNVKEMRERLANVDVNIDYLKQLDITEGLNEERRLLLTRLTKAKFQLQGQMSACEKRLVGVDDLMTRTKIEARVKVRNICYPGVSVSIRGIKYLVREPLHCVCFAYEDASIIVRPFE